MALQSRTITVGADKDVNNGGKNYVSGQVIYIKNEAGVLAPIFRDIDGLDPIAQNTISNVTNAKGQFTFFVEEGNYTAEYNDQSTPLFVFGADYFNNQIDFVTNQILSNTQPYSAGNFTDGFTFTELNQYGNATVNDGGTDYATTFWYIGGTLPHTVAPLTNPRDFPLLYQQRDFNSAEFVATKTTENAQDFIDSFALKIFQSPTDGLTEINTRTLLGGEVYEVRKVSDGSLAAIYTDKEGLNPITQNGAANVSGSDGVVEFFVADGDYYIEVNSVQSNFKVKKLETFDTVAEMTSADFDGYLDYTPVIWQGYYEQSDGGGNKGVLRRGDTTSLVNDNGSIFIIVNDAVNGIWIEANFGARSRVSILKFGARSSNTALDNNSRINRAMDVAESYGTVIFVPKGRFETGQHKGRSNSGIVGIGRDSVLIRNRGLSDFGSLLFLEGGSADPVDNIKNYTIKDVTMEGTVVEDGFSEFKHLVLAQGVSNLYIKRVYFKGWQGDAVVIRSGNNAFKNDTVRIKSCEFDGVNKNNRNAISINDCVGLWITSNVFRNCVRDGDPNYVIGDPFDVMNQASGRGQPGAIDIEPNTQDTYVRVRNIRIRNNEFENIGGNVGCVMMFLPIRWQDMTEYPNDIEVSGNHLRNVYRGFYFTEIQDADIDESAPTINLKIFNNNIQTTTEGSFWIYGLKGVRMEGNFYRDCNRAGRIGWSDANRGTVDVSIKNDTYRYCGRLDGVGVKVYNSIDTTVNATFEEVGASGGGFGVAVEVAGIAEKVKLIRNKIINTQGLTTAAVTVSGSLVKGGNESFNNDWAGLGSSAFTPDYTEYGESTVNESVTASSILGQANATQLEDALNIVTTSNSTNSGVKLPPASNLGRLITVQNKGVAPCAVYPFSGDDLGQGTNVFEQLAVGSTVTYKSYSSSGWIKI